MYRLQRIEDSGTILTLEFNDDLDIWDMRWELRHFLLGCGYMEETVNKILPVDDSSLGDAK